jgi:hypothetical protein
MPPVKRLVLVVSTRARGGSFCLWSLDSGNGGEIAGRAERAQNQFRNRSIRSLVLHWEQKK